MKAAAVTSDGEFFDRPFITTCETVRYRRLQQQLARTNNGSINRRRLLAAMSKIMGRVTDRRTDFCAVTAAHLTTKNALVILEDLKTHTMTASASDVNNRRARGFFFPMLSMMDILPGQNP